MGENMDICVGAEQLVRDLLKAYMEERNFSMLFSMLHKDIIWLGIGARKICRSNREVLAMLEVESLFLNRRFKIVESSYEAGFLGEHRCMVCGELCAAEEGVSKSLQDWKIRFTMICAEAEEGIRLIHAHFSAPFEEGKEVELREITGKLQEKAVELEKLADNLRLSEKRYEVTMKSSGITMFEYNVVNGDLILYETEAQKYAVPRVIPNGVETFVKKGIIEAVSAADYREMYRQIHNGAKTAKCYVKAKDSEGKIYDYELSLTNLFDGGGNPVRAIGVRTNVSHILGLQKEQEFGKNLVSNQVFIFEADITNDTLEYMHEEWENLIQLRRGEGFAAYMGEIVLNYVFKQHQDIFLKRLSKDYIENVLENGSSLFKFSYKRKKEEPGYSWYEATVNIIKDNATGNIRIRFYHMNIDKRKLKEQKAHQEKQLYDAMLAKATLAYEVNITQDCAIKGHEHWEELYHIEKSDDYSGMILEFAKKGTHPEDGEAFYKTFCRENVLEMFAKGERRITCQYRKYNQVGEYNWASCTLHLFEDIETNDVRGFSYVEDIDEQKCAEIALKYDAEHDAMTGLLNKVVVEQKINAFLSSSTGNIGKHAFLIIDIDFFKHINDSFGHLFGDGVIQEIASGIGSVCRDSDIIGRIGGDEFCVFMQNISDSSDAAGKADSICRKLKHTYQREGKSCTISASVGIAIYKEHGRSYRELYQHADRALYHAKKNGKNRYELYQ